MNVQEVRRIEMRGGREGSQLIVDFDAWQPG